jgi:hypothetical protein
MSCVGLLLGCQVTPASNLSQTCENAPCVVVLQESLRLPPTTLPSLPGNQGEPVIRSCTDLLAALRAGVNLGERMEFPQFNAYSNCLAEAVIAQGQGTSISRFDLSQTGRLILTRLDLANVPSSLAPRRPAKHYRLVDFKFSSQRVAPLELELGDDGFTYRFEVLAVGDFRHIGAEELLMRLIDRATDGGTYNRSSLFVLDWAPNNEAIIATDVLGLLRP